MTQPSRPAADVARDITSQCLAMHVRLVERAITRLYSDVTTPHGATVAQITLLAAITRHPGIRATDLATHLSIDASTLSRNLDRLQKLGFVDMRAGEGRNRHLFVTPRGEDVLVAIDTGWREVQRVVRDRLGDDTDVIYSLARSIRGVSPD